MAKGIAEIILAAKKKPGGKDDQQEEEGEDMGLDAAASEVMDALKSGDPSAFKDAMRSFVEMCQSDYDD